MQTTCSEAMRAQLAPRFQIQRHRLISSTHTFYLELLRNTLLRYSNRIPSTRRTHYHNVYSLALQSLRDYHVHALLHGLEDLETIYCILYPHKLVVPYNTPNPTLPIPKIKLSTNTDTNLKCIVNDQNKSSLEQLTPLAECSQLLQLPSRAANNWPFGTLDPTFAQA